MDASLNQPCRVQDEGPMGRKLLLYKKKLPISIGTDGIVRIRIG